MRCPTHNFGWAKPMFIDRVVIRVVHFVFKHNFGWVRCMWAGAPRVCYGAMQFEIDHIVIRKVRYQLEVNRFPGVDNVDMDVMFTWSMWAGRPRIDRIVIRDVHVGGDSGQKERTDGRTDRRRR
ncbi:hypothetical protein DPMN_068921 [Dreissena polymorpha]|uniref:Uncharacterized protein n=1 Tax=Dreissena polymorpha TaxID=45954 RepID=A0A9D4BWX1_DREPO|nr:hypothetical protein DPMN_068921 [Dreissena polymorpha]